MSRPNCVSDASRTSRTYTTPSENSDPSASTIAAVGVITMRTSGMRSASRNRAGCSSLERETSSADRGSRETNRNETTNVSASTKKTSTNGWPPSQPPDGESSGYRAEGRGTERDRAVRRREDRRVRDRQLVAFDQIGDERVTGGRNTMPAASSRNAQTYTHHRCGHQRDGDDDPDPHQVGRLHRAAPIPAPHTAGGERRGRRRRKQAEQQDAADGGRRPRQPQHEGHERDGDHPVAEAGNRLPDEQGAEGGTSKDLSHASILRRSS